VTADPREYVTRLFGLLEQAPAAIAILLGEQHTFEFANPLYMQLIGEDRSVIGKPVAEALPEITDQGFIQVLDNVYRTGQTYSGDEILVKLDRRGTDILEDRYLNFVYQPIKNNQGVTEGIFVHAVEVTEQVKVRRKIQESEEKYRSLFEAMDQGFCILEMIFDDDNNPVDYRFLEINPTFEKQTGLKDAIGRTARELVPNLEQHWFDLYGQVALTGEANRFIDGSEAMGRWFDVYAFRLGGEDSRKVALLFTNITDQRKAETERLVLFEAERSARQEAERANRAKMLFLAMISHELRTPLASIKGFASTILATDVEWDADSQREFIEIIEEEADKLQALIDELLDISRLQSGTFAVNQTSVQTSDLLREAYPQFMALGSKHGLVMNIPNSLPAIYADKGRVVQVLTNLVSNSAKYSPSNTRITLSAEQRDTWIEFRVTDEGIGIPADKHQIVFEPFFQLEGGKKGVGLGLAICKGIVEAHGGRIWIDDNHTPGTCIVFTMPLVE
jgi:PAS domain S-box-containing protein